jgi:sec-independent protein translocase protein TatA
MGILLEGLFFSPTEWLLILGACLLMFGGKKIPEVMKGIGSGIKEFKQAMKENEETNIPEITPVNQIHENNSASSSKETVAGNSETETNLRN